MGKGDAEMPSLPELKAIHAEMLDLLKWFDGFCAAHGVEYTLDAGTLLGAVREGGFIPWDDDTDVALTRAQYERLRDALRAEALPKDVTFSEYSPGHPRLWLRRPNRPGAWIDLFIFDYISENPLAAKLRLLGCAFFLAFTKNPSSMAVTRRANLHHGLRGALLKLGYLLGRPFSAKAKARLQDAFCKHAFRGRRTRIHRCNDNFEFIGKILPATCMARFERLPFEGVGLMVTGDWRAVLTSSFGADYMTPRRTASHDNPAHAGFRTLDNNAKENR